MSGTVSKNKKGYGYKYADLAQIHEYLESIGARYYQYIDRIDGDDYVMTIKEVNGEQSAPLRGCRVVQAALSGKSNPAQEQGSALTYARRYSLLMAFGLATDDDDGEAMTRPKGAAKTSQRGAQSKPQTETPTPPPPTPPDFITNGQINELQGLLTLSDEHKDIFVKSLKYYKVDNMMQLTAHQAEVILERLAKIGG